MGDGVSEPAPKPSQTPAANTIVLLFDENNAAKPGPRPLMAPPNVVSPLDSDEQVTDALPHNGEASNVTNEAPVLDSAALNGIDASLTPGRTGVFVFCRFPVHFYARPWWLSRTHASARKNGSHSF
jgi:hypothetical protein